MKNIYLKFGLGHTMNVKIIRVGVKNQFQASDHEVVLVVSACTIGLKFLHLSTERVQKISEVLSERGRFFSLFILI